MTDHRPQTNDGADLAAIDGADYVALVAAATDEQLAEGLRTHREEILVECFRRFPSRLDRRAATGVDAVIEWVVTGRSDGGEDRFQVTIRNGECTVARDGTAAPRLVLTLDAVDLIRVLTGTANPVRLLLRRRLAISGDWALANRLSGLFLEPADAG